MADTNSKIRDYFRRKNKENMRHDPATEFHFIPLWDKEFLYLLGLEEVVQFRLDLLEKTVYNKPKTKGKKKKKFPELAVEPSTSPKDPLICAQCKTDFSCSWKRDSNGLCLCQSCFKCNWRKEDRSSYRPKETSTSGNSSSSALFSQSINIDHWDEGGGAFSPSLSASAHFQSSDQLVPKVSAFHMSPDNPSSSFLSLSSFSSDSSSCVYSLLSSPFYDSSPLYSLPLSEDSSFPDYASSTDLYSLSSSLSPSPPRFFSDSSSCVYSLLSSDLLSSPCYDSSPLYSLPLSEDSSSPDYASSSDLYSLSSFLSPSPPRSSALYSSKKVGRRSLTKEKQEMKERKKPSTSYRPPYNKEKTEKMPIGASLSSASSSTLGLKQNDTQKSSLSPSPPRSSALYSSKKVGRKGLTKEKQEMKERKKRLTCYRFPHNKEKTEKNDTQKTSLSPSPPRSLALYSSKKVGRKSLTKEKQEMKEKPSTCYRPPHNKQKTEKMPIGGSLSSASSSTLRLKQNDTKKAQVPKGGSKTSTPVLSSRKAKFEPPKLMALSEEDDQGEAQSQIGDGSPGKFTSAEPESSSHSADSSHFLPKIMIHHISTTSETFGGSVEGRQQALGSKSGV